MIINIKRYTNSKNEIESFTIKETNLLKGLLEIKSNIDSSLTFRCGCKSGICGSCSIRVNGIEKLACKTKIKENDLIEPLKNTEVIKDLVVDTSHEISELNTVLSGIKTSYVKNLSSEDIKSIDIQSNCILCNSCYSSCPIYEVNKDFLGPFALTKALRYIKDKKSLSNAEVLTNIQSNGIWDCTLCSACTFVCPQNIDPKNDILQLQNISVQNGFDNPNMSSINMEFESNDFGGFNPNGF